MRTPALFVGCSVLLLACTGDDVPYGPEAGADATSSDAPAPSDGSVDARTDATADAASDAALPPSPCDDGGGCRTFADYCSDAPCTCHALGASEPDPACNGSQVTCLVDPCNGETAVCGDAGTCVLSP